jgi:hypothetical protein
MLQGDSYLKKVTTKNSYWFLRLQKATSSYNRYVGNYEFFSSLQRMIVAENNNYIMVVGRQKTIPIFKSFFFFLFFLFFTFLPNNPFLNNNYVDGPTILHQSSQFLDTKTNISLSMKPRFHQNTRPTLLYANLAAFISWLNVAKKAILEI